MGMQYNLQFRNIMSYWRVYLYDVNTKIITKNIIMIHAFLIIDFGIIRLKYLKQWEIHIIKIGFCKGCKFELTKILFEEKASRLDACHINIVS
jgi:hypothetical protein